MLCVEERKIGLSFLRTYKRYYHVVSLRSGFKIKCLDKKSTKQISAMAAVTLKQGKTGKFHSIH